MKSKKELLSIVGHAAKYINKGECGNFAPILINLADTALDCQGAEAEKKKKLYLLIDGVVTTNVNLIGGGKSVKLGYKRFVEEFLKIKKTGEDITCGNQDFAELTVSECKYVFVWMRRLMKAGSQGGNRGNSSYNPNNKNYKDRSK